MDFFSKCDFLTFTEEIPNGKLHFLCSKWYEIVPFNLNVLKQLLERKRTYLENLAENASFTFLACNMNIIVKDFINSIILNLVKSNGHS